MYLYPGIITSVVDLVDMYLLAKIFVVEVETSSIYHIILYSIFLL